MDAEHHASTEFGESGMENDHGLFHAVGGGALDRRVQTFGVAPVLFAKPSETPRGGAGFERFRPSDRESDTKTVWRGIVLSSIVFSRFIVR